MKSWNLASSVFLFSQLTSFQIHTYFGFPFCDFCSNYLWGLTQQGFQCQDCGINVHHQCKDELPADCKPSKKRISKGMHIPRGQSLNSSQILQIDVVISVLFGLISVLAAVRHGTEMVYDLTNSSLDSVLLLVLTCSLHFSKSLMK